MVNESILIPYRRSKDSIQVFLQKRTADAPRLPDYFGLFGGSTESGESPEAALQRETQEELSIKPQGYELLGKFEFSDRIKFVFIMEVDDGFIDRVKVNEGQYGKYLSENDISNENKIDKDDRSVLRVFFSKLASK
jgi:mutator protein MutT